MDNLENNQFDEYPIGESLKESCACLWNIYTDHSAELREVSDAATDSGANPLTDMKAYVRENWDKDAMIGYHMGNIYKTSDYSIFEIALNKCSSKISALKNLFEDYPTNNSIESLKMDIRAAQSMLNAGDKEELLWAYIKNEYDYWANASEDVLYAI